jgi:hypothetical protein
MGYGKRSRPTAKTTINGEKTMIQDQRKNDAWYYFLADSARILPEANKEEYLQVLDRLGQERPRLQPLGDGDLLRNLVAMNRFLSKGVPDPDIPIFLSEWDLRHCTSQVGRDKWGAIFKLGRGASVDRLSCAFSFFAKLVDLTVGCEWDFSFMHDFDSLADHWIYAHPLGANESLSASAIVNELRKQKGGLPPLPNQQWYTIEAVGLISPLATPETPGFPTTSLLWNDPESLFASPFRFLKWIAKHPDCKKTGLVKANWNRWKSHYGKQMIADHPLSPKMEKILRSIGEGYSGLLPCPIETNGQNNN